MASPLYELRVVRNWSELAQLQEFFFKKRVPWLFRGQSNEKWRLTTTLERAVEPLKTKGLALEPLEGGLLRLFKRQAHHYLPESPRDNSWLEWLALMQHYGAPTRLQDWTYSFFVGLYFAIQGSTGPSALWALDSKWTRKRVRALLGKKVWKMIQEDPNLTLIRFGGHLKTRTMRKGVHDGSTSTPYVQSGV